MRPRDSLVWETGRHQGVRVNDLQPLQRESNDCEHQDDQVGSLVAEFLVFVTLKHLGVKRECGNEQKEVGHCDDESYSLIDHFLLGRDVKLFLISSGYQA